MILEIWIEAQTILSKYLPTFKKIFRTLFLKRLKFWSERLGLKPNNLACLGQNGKPQSNVIVTYKVTWSQV